MRHLDQALNAALDAAVETVLAGFGAAEEAQRSARGKGKELRSSVALQELLGPALSSLASKLVGEVERRTVPRYAAALKHPRYGREALIDEQADAEVAISVAISAASQPPTAGQLLSIVLAIVKIRAIVQALGPKCFADPVRPKAEKGYPVPRRRSLTAADVGDEIAQLILSVAERGDDWREHLAPLRQLETSPVNNAGVVSKIVALCDHENGRSHIDQMAGALRQAGIHRREPVIDAETGVASAGEAADIVAISAVGPRPATSQGGLRPSDAGSRPVAPTGQRRSMAVLAARARRPERDP